MKTISLSFIFLCTTITMQAQNLNGTLVFSHHNDTSTIHPDTIYSINNAGQKTFVTLGYRPVVSHTGNYMAFANGQNPNQSLDASLLIRNLVTHKDTLVFFNGGDYLDYFDFSPHDSQLAYGFACSMYTSNIDGTNSFHDIGCTPCDCYSDQPVVRLSDSLVTYHNVHYGIYTKNYDGSNPLQVPNTLPGDLFPVWSPDGQWIAWYKTKPGLFYVTNAIYKIKPDGANKTLLLQLAASDTLTADPLWSTDMNNIFFIARIQNSLGIYKVKTDGSGNYQKIFALSSASINDYWLGLTDFASGTLPLTLTDFTATYQSKAVHLAWQTEQEINTSYFDIERSIDAINFSKIGGVAAKENSNVLANYSFTDNALPFVNGLQQTLEYRLKMIDKDGHFTYSKIVAISFSASTSIKITPNPAKNILRITGLNASVPVAISIINVSGNRVKKITARNNNYLCDVSSLPSGTYYISIAEDKKITNLKFVKE